MQTENQTLATFSTLKHLKLAHISVPHDQLNNSSSALQKTVRHQITPRKYQKSVSLFCGRWRVVKHCIDVGPFGCGRLFALQRAAWSAQLDGAQRVEQLVKQLPVTQFCEIALLLRG